MQDNYVKLWLKELKDLARDAEDVLNDYRYELLQCQIRECQVDCPRKRKHLDTDEKDDDSINEVCMQLFGAEIFIYNMFN